MAQEGLAASDRTVKVWEEHKKTIIRSYGWLEEDKRKFKIYRPHDSQQETSLFSNQNHTKEILNDFIESFLIRQRGRLQNNTKTDEHIAININDITNINILFQTYFRFKWDKYRSKISEKQKKASDEKEKERLGDQLERSEQNIFNQTIAFFLNDIPAAYKAFRKKICHVEDKRWNLVLCKKSVKNKNQALHSDEQAFLIYIVNTICYNIYQRYLTYLQETKHPYVNTYIKNCKPVIAIDEATDFSIIDLLAMHSFRHPDISAVTLSGDLMQRITMHGLKTWEDFSDMIYSTEIKNLTLSYRQSPTLLSLAQKIHEYSTKRKTDYTSYMKNDTSEPKPLMKISENENDKLNWIAQRIREIDAIYRQSVGSLPSVAVFVPAEENIDDFVSALDEKLEGDIPVQGCHKGKVLGKSSDVRVYAVDKIKGLEFEAVFFHNLDQLTHLQDDILLKYLYVGLSRATFYLGVTLSKDLDDNLHFIEESFVQNANWNLS
jgi:superfamily I DNA/RNA helicase